LLHFINACLLPEDLDKRPTVQCKRSPSWHSLAQCRVLLGLGKGEPRGVESDESIAQRPLLDRLVQNDLVPENEHLHSSGFPESTGEELSSIDSRWPCREVWDEL